MPTRNFLDTSGRIAQSTAFARSFLSSERFRFVSRIFRFKRGGRGEFRRRSCAAAARFNCRAAARRPSSASSKRSSASWRFRAWERESCTVTVMPLGACFSVTAVETLLTCWPPGPDERANVSFSSVPETPSRLIRSVRFIR